MQEPACSGNCSDLPQSASGPAPGPAGAGTLDQAFLNRYIAVMSGQDRTDDGRATRLAEALRQNLRKRKVQARARKEAAGEADETNGTDGADRAAAVTTTRRDGADRPQD